jgi:serine/threonine protein phosphatase PrpC
MGRRWRGEGAQHQGARPYQEDSWALRGLADDALLAVLADGMGGHTGGSIASRLAVGAFIMAVEQGGSLAEALQAANLAIAEGVSRKPELRGMGSTLVAVMVKGDAVMWISVGDSPLYLVQDGGLERLNADHSMVPQIDELVTRGVLSAAEAAHHPGRHTLREAVMGERLTLIDQGSRSLQPGGRLLVCSDGIQSLDDARIAEKAARPAQELIEAVLAVAAPAQDNVTVIKLEREE